MSVCVTHGMIGEMALFSELGIRESGIDAFFNSLISNKEETTALVAIDVGVPKFSWSCISVEGGGVSNCSGSKSGNLTVPRSNVVAIDVAISVGVAFSPVLAVLASISFPSQSDPLQQLH